MPLDNVKIRICIEKGFFEPASLENENQNQFYEDLSRFYRFSGINKSAKQQFVELFLEDEKDLFLLKQEDTKPIENKLSDKDASYILENPFLRELANPVGSVHFGAILPLDEPIPTILLRCKDSTKSNGNDYVVSFTNETLSQLTFLFGAAIYCRQNLNNTLKNAFKPHAQPGACWIIVDRFLLNNKFNGLAEILKGLVAERFPAKIFVFADFLVIDTGNIENKVRFLREELEKLNPNSPPQIDVFNLEREIHDRFLLTDFGLFTFGDSILGKEKRKKFSLISYLGLGSINSSLAQRMEKNDFSVYPLEIKQQIIDELNSKLLKK